MTIKTILAVLGITLLANKIENSRNIENAKKLGWGAEYSNEKPYPGLVEYDENKEYVGLNYDLLFNKNKYVTVKSDKMMSILTLLGNQNNIIHANYKSQLLKLKKGDKITGIQFRIVTGVKISEEPSGNREWSTPSNFQSKGYKISLGNSKKIDLTLDYLSNIKQSCDFTSVKKEVKWKDEEWPFGKIPLNNFGPILRFNQDKEFTYLGGDLILEINYPEEQYNTELEDIKTLAQGYENISENLSEIAFFNHNTTELNVSLKDWCLDIQFEVIRNKEN